MGTWRFHSWFSDNLEHQKRPNFDILLWSYQLSINLLRECDWRAIAKLRRHESVFAKCSWWICAMSLICPQAKLKSLHSQNFSFPLHHCPISHQPCWTKSFGLYVYPAHRLSISDQGSRPVDLVLSPSEDAGSLLSKWMTAQSETSVWLWLCCHREASILGLT